MPEINRQLILHSRPKGCSRPATWNSCRRRCRPFRTASAGKSKIPLRRSHHARLDGGDTYLPACVIGEVMRAIGLAEVVESRHKDFKKATKSSA